VGDDDNMQLQEYDPLTEQEIQLGTVSGALSGYVEMPVDTKQKRVFSLFFPTLPLPVLVKEAVSNSGLPTSKLWCIVQPYEPCSPPGDCCEGKRHVVQQPECPTKTSVYFRFQDPTKKLPSLYSYRIVARNGGTVHDTAMKSSLLEARLNSKLRLEESFISHLTPEQETVVTDIIMAREAFAWLLDKNGERDLLVVADRKNFYVVDPLSLKKIFFGSKSEVCDVSGPYTITSMITGLQKRGEPTRSVYLTTENEMYRLSFSQRGDSASCLLDESFKQHKGDILFGVLPHFSDGKSYLIHYKENKFARRPMIDFIALVE
jgi:hypothetical protein